MSDEEKKPKVERVDLATGGSKLAAFRAFRSWAEALAKREGQTMSPSWYKDGPEDCPELYETTTSPPQKEGSS